MLDTPTIMLGTPSNTHHFYTWQDSSQSYDNTIPFWYLFFFSFFLSLTFSTTFLPDSFILPLDYRLSLSAINTNGLGLQPSFPLQKHNCIKNNASTQTFSSSGRKNKSKKRKMEDGRWKIRTTSSRRYRKIWKKKEEK